jgi:hypothetical protein
MAYSSPSFEGLEARVLMSADVGLNVYLDGDFAAGQASQVTVSIDNYSEHSTSGQGTVQFYLVPDDVEYEDVPAKTYLIYSHKISLSIGVEDYKDAEFSLPLSENISGGSYTLYVKLVTPFTDECPEDNYQEFRVDVEGKQLDIGFDGADIAVAGRKLTGTAYVYNYSNYSDVGPIDFKIYAVPLGGDADQKVLVTSISRNVTFDEDGYAEVNVSATVPAAIADGRYTIIIQADARDREDIAPDDNSIEMPSSVFVGQLRLDVGISDVNGEIEADRGGYVWATVDCIGGITQAGQVEFTVYLSASGVVDDQAVKLITFQEVIDFGNPDDMNSFGIYEFFQVPDGLAVGEYQLIVVATTLDQTDVNLANNIAVGVDLLTVPASLPQQPVEPDPVVPVDEPQQPVESDPVAIVDEPQQPVETDPVLPVDETQQPVDDPRGSLVYPQDYEFFHIGYDDTYYYAHTCEKTDGDYHIYVSLSPAETPQASLPDAVGVDVIPDPVETRITVPADDGEAAPEADPSADQVAETSVLPAPADCQYQPADIPALAVLADAEADSSLTDDSLTLSQANDYSNGIAGDLLPADLAVAGGLAASQTGPIASGALPETNDSMTIDLLNDSLAGLLANSLIGNDLLTVV